MSNIELKRSFVHDMYKGKSSWQKRVKKMSDSQIVAIYMKHYQVPKAKDAKRNLDNDPTLF